MNCGERNASATDKEGSLAAPDAATAFAAAAGGRRTSSAELKRLIKHVRDDQTELETLRTGTLFLREIDATPADVQERIVELLSEQSNSSSPRVMAATSESLIDLVDQDRFQRDLYFQLTTLVIDVPPLAQRPEDILPLMTREEFGEKLYEIQREESRRWIKIIAFFFGVLIPLMLVALFWRDGQNWLVPIAVIATGVFITWAVFSTMRYNDRRPERFGQFACSDSPPEVDLKQSISGGDVSLREEEILHRLGVNVRDTPAVPKDFDRFSQPGDRNIPGAEDWRDQN